MGTGCSGETPVGGHSLVWDESEERSLLFGQGETWAWDGERWEPWCGPGTDCDNPIHTGTRRAAYLPDRRRSYVVTEDGAIRAFDARARRWQVVCVAALDCLLDPPQRDFALAQGVVGGRRTLLLFGGEWDDEGPDINVMRRWDWDRQAWEFEAPDAGAPRPLSRFMHDLVFDAARGSVLLFGGDDNQDDGGLWEWRPGGWTDVCRPGRCRQPSPRYLHELAWDPVGERVLLHGGNGGSDETWLWSQAPNRPTQRWHFHRFETRPGDEVSIHEVALQAWVGGTGQVSGVEVHGARLQLWDRGAWRPLADNAAPAAAPGPLTWESGRLSSWTHADPWFLARVFQLSDSGRLPLALQPLGANGSGSARLSTDGLELSVRYTWRAPAAPCVLGADDPCAEGACYPIDNWEEARCQPPSQTADGAACATHAECRPGSACDDGAPGGLVCRPRCVLQGDGRACGPGTYCSARGRGVGVCLADTDCSDAVAVQLACTDRRQDNCTCAPQDPCGWRGNERCQSYCALAFPDAHFDDGADCYDCADADAVEAACLDDELDHCTCAQGDPCGWMENGHCGTRCLRWYRHDRFDDRFDCAHE